MSRRLLVTVIERKEYGCASELVFEIPASFQPRPGQFIHVLCDGEGRILRRPYSLFSHRGERASILVREVGSGSSWLRGREPGDVLDLLGPLGRGFEVAGEGRDLLVAGGAGIAPLRFLCLELREREVESVLLWGMGDSGEYGDMPEMLREEAELRLASLDGSLGWRGTVVDLARTIDIVDFREIFACGPRSMLKALVEVLPAGKLGCLQVSMEERMACGVGACRGCAVPAAHPVGDYLTVCKDGPVFRGEELDWARMREST